MEGSIGLPAPSALSRPGARLATIERTDDAGFPATSARLPPPDPSSKPLLSRSRCGVGNGRKEGGQVAARIRIFVSFDLEHDRDLYALMLDEAALPNSGFEVSGHSEIRSAMDHSSEVARRGIEEADGVIFICGEHTEGALPMGNELRLAQEGQTPYLLLWGRREIMCTKPIGAKPAEGMYSWTSEIMKTQLEVMLRTSRREPKPTVASAAAAKG